MVGINAPLLVNHKPSKHDVQRAPGYIGQDLTLIYFPNFHWTCLKVMVSYLFNNPFVRNAVEARGRGDLSLPPTFLD